MSSPTIAYYAGLFEAHLSSLTFRQEPANLYEPVDYIMRLGGKRLRPLLLLMSYHLYRDCPDEVLPAATAIEVFHNFTLVHDDIMDAAPLRRNNPTVHTRFGSNAAILSGDVMMFLAYRQLLELPTEVADPKLLAVFNRTAIEVCEGQQMDVDFETREAVTIPEYIEMIRLKTAVLLGAALQMGAIAARADDHDCELLYQFGNDIGIAFQLQDDYLDTFGASENFGKQIGGDILNNKKTFLILKALETADPTDRDQLRALITMPTQDADLKIATVKDILTRAGIREYARDLRDRYLHKALESLKAVRVSDDKKAALYEFAQMLVERNV